VAQVASFDPLTLRIVELAVSGDTSIDWIEVYSEWKDWVLTDPIARGGYPPAFRVVGGEERGGGAPRLGTTFFLCNGWKFRPAEYSHHVTLNGNIVTDPAGARVWVPTLGAYTVGVQLESSNLVDTVAVGSGVLPADVTAIATATRDAILSDSVPFPGANIDAAISSAGGSLTVEQAAQLAAVATNADVATSTRAASGSVGLTVEQATQLAELWRLAALDPAVALTVAAAYRRAGAGIQQTVAEADGVVTVTRDP
jgi:hypothetical protein